MKTISTPASTGPMMRVRFIPALLSEMAFMRCPSGTISEMSDWRLGMLKAAMVPLQNPSTMRCQNWTTPVISRTARSRVRRVLPLRLSMMIFRREIRSAKAPPKTAARVRGSAKDIMTSERARGESSVRRRISQPRVICCMPTAMKEKKVPSQSHR